MPQALYVVAAGSRDEAQLVVAMHSFEELLVLKKLVVLTPVTREGRTAFPLATVVFNCPQGSTGHLEQCGCKCAGQAECSNAVYCHDLSQAVGEPVLPPEAGSQPLSDSVVLSSPENRNVEAGDVVAKDQGPLELCPLVCLCACTWRCFLA